MLLIASLAIYIYLSSINNDTWKPSKFYAYCDSKNGVIIISARENIENVLVKDIEGNIICKIEKINADSEDICPVNNTTGIFTVESSGIKKVVNCYTIEGIPIGAD